MPIEDVIEFIGAEKIKLNLNLNSFVFHAKHIPFAW